MNFYSIIYYLGWVLEISAAALLLPAAIGLYYGERAWVFFALSALICAAFGTLMVIKKPKYNGFYAKEGFVTVALAWLLMSLIGAVPLYLSGDIRSYLDAFFETASGLSTTGSTILLNVSSLSHASLFWRSLTHFIGGMGVLVFLLAILPGTGGGSFQLMRAESPGPSVGKIVPKLKDTALILYILYTVMTVLEAIILLFGGMPWFDAITTALSTAGTGGFSIRNNSIAFYHSNYVEIVVTVFMFLFGVNFNLYYLALNKRFKDIFKNEELWVYIFLVVGASAIFVLNIKSLPEYQGRLGIAIKDAAFTTNTIMSTSGFGTVDFNNWPTLSKSLIFALMFVGACAGSTGGGLKISRLIILFKSSFAEVSRLVHPRSVRAVTLDGRRIDKNVIRQTKSYFGIFIAIYVISCLIVGLDNHGVLTSITAVASSLNNIGPGLDLVGPAGNYSIFSPLSKLVLIFDMLAGRLELIPMLVLFSPTTFKDTANAVKRRLIWKKKT